MKRLFPRRTLRLVFSAAASGGVFLSSAEAATIISFNAIGIASGGMGATEVAGAPGAVASNWNNMNSVQGTAGQPITGSLGAGTIRDNTGAILNLTTLTWSGTGVANAAGSGTGDQKMFESEWDLFDTGSNTAVADMVFTLTNVPFAIYDVYFYVQDAAGATSTNRGGDITANGLTESIKMYPQTSDIPGGAFAYVEADNQFTFNATNTTLGTYLKIQGVTGETLSLAISSKNTSVPRLRMSGFQVVDAVPEPGTAVCLLAGLGTLLGARRRRPA